ncbi:paeninodin family lasso peptide [Cohnella soli]|uniref:Paeninodin family lasso peptide n=1 Tax=Cohnella soli TaxID=425005 RepID=A0ABW0I268_9BACL
MASKKEWQSPSLEELNVNQTMASTRSGPLTDEAYVPGVRSNDPRFTS